MEAAQQKKHMRTTESPFPEADKRTIHSRIYKWDIWVQELTNQEDSFTEARSCMFYVRFTRSQEQHSFLKYVFWRFVLRSVLLRCLCIMLVCICAWTKLAVPFWPKQLCSQSIRSNWCILGFLHRFLLLFFFNETWQCFPKQGQKKKKKKDMACLLSVSQDTLWLLPTGGRKWCCSLGLARRPGTCSAWQLLQHCLAGEQDWTKASPVHRKLCNFSKPSPLLQNFCS